MRRLLIALVVTAGLALAPTCGNPSQGGPPYPIVLAHGFLGMQSYGPLDYWYDIVSELQNAGNDVHVAQVSAIESSFTRGEQLLTQVEDIIALTGKAKVHLIGHSQGGLDARYVAGVKPHLVSSVTTIATPHQGSDVAQFIVDGILADGSFTGALLNLFGASVAPILELLGGTTDPLDARAAMSNLIGPALAQFNFFFPNGLPTGCNPGPALVDGIRYYSWTGVQPLTNFLDPTDALIGLSSLVYVFEQNDGLVTRCSSQFGDVIRDDYAWNHIDEVNQILGLVNFFESNPKSVFVQHADRLRNLGL